MWPVGCVRPGSDMEREFCSLLMFLLSLVPKCNFNCTKAHLAFWIVLLWSLVTCILPSGAMKRERGGGRLTMRLVQ